MRFYLKNDDTGGNASQPNSVVVSEATPNNSRKFETVDGHSMEIKTDAAGRYIEYSTDFVLTGVFPKISFEKIDFVTFEEHVVTSGYHCKAQAGNYRIGKSEITVTNDWMNTGHEVVYKKVIRIKSSLQLNKLRNLWNRLLAGEIKPTKAY